MKENLIYYRRTIGSVSEENTKRYIERQSKSYCRENRIHTVVIGDLKNTRNDKNFGHVTNQQYADARMRAKFMNIFASAMKPQGMQLAIIINGYRTVRVIIPTTSCDYFSFSKELCNMNFNRKEDAY